MTKENHDYHFSVKVDGNKKDSILEALRDDDVSVYDKNWTYLYPEIYSKFNLYFKKLLDKEELIIRDIKYVVFYHESYDYIVISYKINYEIKDSADKKSVSHVLNLKKNNFVYNQYLLILKENSSLKMIYDSNLKKIENLKKFQQNLIEKDKEKLKFDEIMLFIEDELSFLYPSQKEQLKIYLCENDNNISKFIFDNKNYFTYKYNSFLESKSKEIIKTKTFLFKKFTYSKSLEVEKTFEDKINDSFTVDVNKIDSWSKITECLRNDVHKKEIEDILIKLQTPLLISLKDRYTLFDMLLIDDFDNKITKLSTYLSLVSSKNTINESEISLKTKEVLNNFYSFYEEYDSFISFVYQLPKSNGKVEKTDILDEIENLKF